jgi:hypothetical protein
MPDNEKPDWLIACEERERKQEKFDRISNVIIYGAFALWIAYSYFTADEHKQETIWLWLVGGFVYYTIEQKLIAIYKKLEEIEDRIIG